MPSRRSCARTRTRLGRSISRHGPAPHPEAARLRPASVPRGRERRGRGDRPLRAGRHAPLARRGPAAPCGAGLVPGRSAPRRRPSCCGRTAWCSWRTSRIARPSRRRWIRWPWWAGGACACAAWRWATPRPWPRSSGWWRRRRAPKGDADGRSWHRRVPDREGVRRAVAPGRFPSHGCARLRGRGRGHRPWQQAGDDDVLPDGLRREAGGPCLADPFVGAVEAGFAVSTHLASAAHPKEVRARPDVGPPRGARQDDSQAPRVRRRVPRRGRSGPRDRRTAGAGRVRPADPPRDRGCRGIRAIPRGRGGARPRRVGHPGLRAPGCLAAGRIRRRWPRCCRLPARGRSTPSRSGCGPRWQEPPSRRRRPPRSCSSSKGKRGPSPSRTGCPTSPTSTWRSRRAPPSPTPSWSRSRPVSRSVLSVRSRPDGTVLDRRRVAVCRRAATDPPLDDLPGRWGSGHDRAAEHASCDRGVPRDRPGRGALHAHALRPDRGGSDGGGRYLRLAPVPGGRVPRRQVARRGAVSLLRPPSPSPPPSRARSSPVSARTSSIRAAPASRPRAARRARRCAAVAAAASSCPCGPPCGAGCRRARARRSRRAGPC